MLFFKLKRCVFRTQMRQLCTLNIYNRNHVKMLMPCCVEFKFQNWRNSNCTVSNLFHTNPESTEVEKVLPPLMWYPKPESIFIDSIRSIISVCTVRWTIDKNFNLFEFFRGAKVAMKVISNALAKEQYDMLKDLVKERTLKILKKRISHLTQEQQSLLYMYNLKLYFYNLKILKNKDQTESLVEIMVFGYYTNADLNSEFLTHPPRYLLTCAYVFQRRYRDDVAGPWEVKIVNHQCDYVLFPQMKL